MTIFICPHTNTLWLRNIESIDRCDFDRPVIKKINVSRPFMPQYYSYVISKGGLGVDIGG